MNKVVIFLSISFIGIFTACKEKSTVNGDTSYVSNFNTKAGMEIIQFHSEHRCKTCLKIEENVQLALKPYDNIPFKLINADDEANAALTKEFEAAGTALFLYNPVTGKKRDLTDFAFMTAFEDEKFIKGLQREIDQF